MTGESILPYFGAILVLFGVSGCVSDMAPQITLLVEGTKGHAQIENLSDDPVQIVDAGYVVADAVPTAVYVRYRAGAEILANQIDTTEGWWSPHYLSSQLQMEPSLLLELQARQKVEFDFDVETVAAGIRFLHPPLAGTCQFQLRIDVFYDADARTRVTTLSPWKTIDCSSINGRGGGLE